MDSLSLSVLVFFKLSLHVPTDGRLSVIRCLVGKRERERKRGRERERVTRATTTTITHSMHAVVRFSLSLTHGK